MKTALSLKRYTNLTASKTVLAEDQTPNFRISVKIAVLTEFEYSSDSPWKSIFLRAVPNSELLFIKPTIVNAHFTGVTKRKLKMTDTATIYYHQLKTAKNSNQRKERLKQAQYNIDRITQESKIPGALTRTPPTVSREHVQTSLPPSLTLSSAEAVETCTSNTLRSLGLTGKYDGFKYICKAVEEILACKDSPHFQSIYYDIGKAYGVNRCSVERSIRYSISYIKKNVNYSKLAAFFGEAITDEKNFSNSKFLLILSADVYEKIASLELEA